MLRGVQAAQELTPTRFGGHSLGEYTALVAAGVLPLADALRVVRERGRLMQEAVPVGMGRMTAVIGDGLDPATVARAIAGLEVTIANDNSPEQLVLSGRAADVRESERRLGENGGALRLVELDVSAPFHSPLMATIEPAFAVVLGRAAIVVDGAPSVTSNLTGGFHEADPALLRARLVRQISGTVRWRENMRVLTAQPTTVIE